MCAMIAVEVHARRTSGSGKTEQEGHGGGHRVRFGDSAKYSTRSKRRDNPNAVKVQGQGAHERLAFSLRPVKRGRPPRLDTTTPIPIRSEESEQPRGAIFLALPLRASSHSFLGWTGARARAGLGARQYRLTLHSGRAWGGWEAGGSCRRTFQVGEQVGTDVRAQVSGAAAGKVYRAGRFGRQYAVRPLEASA